VRCGIKETKKETKKSVPSNAGPVIPKWILLAEDNKTIQKLVFRFLKYIGFEVATASNGFEALALFQEKYFDLVLTDYQMPVMDGLRLAGHIKGRSPGTPVIMMTGSDREIVRQKMDKEAVEFVIFKPFKLQDLQRTVSEAFASRVL
jgi:CheY-like chemotaxis protein